MEAIRHTLRPRQMLTRQAFENAIAVAMALGGSTNAVLHLLAIAHAARGSAHARRLRSDAVAGAGALRPEALGALRRDRAAPGRRRSAGDEDPARAHGVLHGDALTITGETIAEVLRDVPANRATEQEVIRPWRPAALRRRATSRSCAAISPSKARWRRSAGSRQSKLPVPRGCSSPRRTVSTRSWPASIKARRCDGDPLRGT